MVNQFLWNNGRRTPNIEVGWGKCGLAFFNRDIFSVKDNR
jgi:hypothetical protein